MEGPNVHEQIDELISNQNKIRAILNIILDFLPNGAAIRAKVEDDQSSAGFLE